MKALLFISMSALAALSFNRAEAQTPSSPEEQQRQVVAFIQEIKAQQAQITDNQAKIDQKLADLTESIRVARLFAGKAGK